MNTCIRQRIYRTLGMLMVASLSACGRPLTATPTPMPASATATQPAASPTTTSEPATVTPEPTPNAVVPSGTGTGLGLNPAPLAAVQTIVDYYTAINQQRYADAYAFWAQPSQTLAQFSAGFATTVESRIRIGQGDLSLDRIIVPVTVAAVGNLANGDQQVQWFAGTYTVQNNTILAADMAATPPPASADDSDPALLVTNYYAALQQLQFSTAYTLWADNGGASQRTYADFVQHIADTQGATVTTGTVQQEGAAGSTYATIPVVVVVAQGTDMPRVLCGTYTARHVMVPPFDQLGWQLTQSDIQQVPTQTHDDATIQRLLHTGCMP